MNMSRLIVHSITFTALVVAFILLWDHTQETSSAEDYQTYHQIEASTQTDLQDDLYRMLPVIIGVIVLSVAFGIVFGEWVTELSWTDRSIDLIISFFAGIPSVFYGLICIYVFVFKIGSVSYLTQSLTVIILAMPITIKSTRNAIKGVDMSIREAAYALGVNKWRVISDHVIPHAFSNILSGICAVIARTLAVAALIIAVYEWTRNINQSDVTFEIPQNIIILLILTLLFSVFSSLLKKPEKYG